MKFPLPLLGGALVAFGVTAWLSESMEVGVIAAIELFVLASVFFLILALLNRFKLTTRSANPLVVSALALVAVMYVSLSTAGA